MTGEENKIRVIVSQRLISPLSCCNNFNSKALEFRASIKESLSVSRLNPDIATKSMLGAKPTYEDTDNKKRDSTGATKPGVVEISPGIRTESKQAWENGRSLVLYPSRASKLSMSPEANFGWLKDAPDSDFNTANNRRKSKPQIKFTKYDVDPRTDDIIPSSETEIDMAYPSMGLSRAQRRRKKMHVENPKMQFKAGLPGRSLSSRIPDGDLLARAAGRFGIMRDANNKFRCPPGTPAANQFTNHLGTNCFGVSAERAAKFVADKIADLMKVRADDSSPLSLASGRKGSPREVLRSGADFDADGVKIPIPDARAMDVPETTRWFKNATINAQDSLKKQKQIIRGLLNNPKLRPEILKILGADDISEIDEMTNKDIYALFTVLRNNGLWDLKIVGGGLKGSPLDDNQVKELVMSRLESIPGWASLTPDEQNALIKADTTRYYESERAILETLLEQYVINPEHMRTVGAVVLSNEPLPDSSEATTSWSSKTKGADIRSVIKFHIPQIMENQETMIPQLEPRQRLMVSAEGAKTDAEAMSLVADFLINANYPAREMAAMVGGISSFVRHITAHEIAHTIQGEAFLSAIFDEIKRTGGIEVFDQKGASKIITEFENLTGGDLANLMVSMQDNISIEGLNGVMSRIDNVAFLSGEYPTNYEEGSDHRALEVTAELFALRANGFIHGDDIDDALSWMDEALGKTTSEAREVMSLELLESLDEAYISPFSRGEDILPIRKHLRKPIELNLDAISAARRKKEIKKFRDDVKGLDESQLVDELAERMGERDVLEELRNDPSISPAELKRVENNINQLDEYISAIFDSYRESFSMGGPESNKAAKEKLERLATELYLSAPPKSAKEAARRVEINRKNALRADAAVMTESELVKLIADYEVQINSLKPDDDKTLKLVTDKEIHVEQYILNKRAAGDTRTNREIKNELRKKVTTEITASRDALDTARRGSMKPQQLKSKADIAMNAKKERARLRRSITKQQAAAVKEIDNFDEAGVTQILNPTNSAVVGRAINRRNARLRRLGLEIDDSSVDEGSLDKQVENILIPTMEAMDASSITTPFEMELFLDSSVVTGVKRSKEIELSTFSQGKVLSKNMKPGVRPKGSKKKRVIVRMKEGDRGLFPLAGKDSNQKFVIPPGKMRVVGRSKDGSLIVEVSSQKDTVDTIDDLAVSIKNGPGDFIWRVGAHRKIQSIANNYAIKRKGDSVGTKSDDAKKVLETSESVIAEITKTGSDFGGTISGITSDGEGISFSSGRKQGTEALRTNRHSQFKSVIGESGSRPESLELSLLALREEDSELASSVEEILDSESIEEVIERIENAAQKMHSGFDRRVRVRMNEDEISELSKSGKIRAVRNTDSPVVSGVSRRAQRLSLSSGAKIMSRGDKEKEFAEKVKERIEAKLSKIPPPKLDDKMNEKARGEAIRKNVDDWFDSLPDAELEAIGARRFYDVDGNPIVSKTTGRIIYQTENNEVAASLLSLGQTVEMPEHKRGESLMVKQAAKQIKKALKDLAKENPGQIVTADLCKFYVEGKNVFCSKNLKVDRLEMPQVGGRAINNESMSLRLWGSGLATAETAQAHPAGEDGKLTMRLKTQLNTLKKEGKTIEAEELDKDIKALEWIGLGFEGAGVEQKDITPEQQLLMDKYGFSITGRELKRLGEKWNRAATARMEGREPDPDDELTDEERKNFFAPSNLDYAMLEPDGVDAFTNFLKMLGVEVQEDRVTKPDELMASQRELDGPKVDAISENITSAVKRIAGITDPAERKKEVERLRRENGLFKKILISKEGYIVDGHHRIIGKVVTNGILSDDMPGLDQDDLDLLGLPVRQIDMGIIELLTVSRVYQDFLGIKAASLSESDDDPFKTAGVVGKKSKKLITDAEDMHGIDKIPKITQQEFDAAHEELLSNIEEKTDEIYERGQFIQVDSVGLNNTEQSVIYKESELLRQAEATSRNQGRKVAKEIELSLASGAQKDSKTGRSVGKDRNKKESVKKDVAAEWFSAFESVEGLEDKNRLNSSKKLREYYESVGLGKDVRDDLMPLSGYLVHKSHIRKKKNEITKNRSGNIGPDAIFEIEDNDVIGDGLTAFGDVEIVLKPEVSVRTSYGKGSGVQNGHRPVMMDSTSIDDIAHAFSSPTKNNPENRMSDSVIGLLASSIDGDFSRVSKNNKTNSFENFEAHILGGFDRDEVDSINYPYSKLSKISKNENISDVVNDNTIADILRKKGFTQEEIDYYYSVGGDKQINTESMQKLKEYRMAKKIKKKYSDLGFPDLKIAHPQGFNIENPRTYSKASRGIEDIEKLLRQEIIREIMLQADELLKDMRKNKKTNLISKVGSGV